MLRRILAMVPVVLIVSVVTFALIHFVAGEFVPGLTLNPHLTGEDIDRIRGNLGLDQPLVQQYLTWLVQLLKGDFGYSLTDGSSVWSLIADHLSATLLLVGTAMIVALVVAVPLGVFQAVRPNSRFDKVTSVGAAIGYSTPQFWLGLIAILVFSVWIRDWGLPGLPSSGDQTPFDGSIADRAKHLILPVSVLSLGYIATWSRFVRSSTLEVLSSDYVRTARSKGMSETRVVYVHALRNSLLPVITLVALELPALVSGAAVVEIVFGWPGIGQLAYNRALQYDYTTVMGLTLFATILVLVGNLLADLLYSVVNPRIRYR
jgi:peptide/nickel transport system permease protein